MLKSIAIGRRQSLYLDLYKVLLHLLYRTAMKVLSIVAAINFTILVKIIIIFFLIFVLNHFFVMKCCVEESYVDIVSSCVFWVLYLSVCLYSIQLNNGSEGSSINSFCRRTKNLLFPEQGVFNCFIYSQEPNISINISMQNTKKLLQIAGTINVDVVAISTTYVWRRVIIMVSDCYSIPSWTLCLTKSYIPKFSGKCELAKRHQDNNNFLSF